jgi:hypothetical protein
VEQASLYAAAAIMRNEALTVFEQRRLYTVSVDLRMNVADRLTNLALRVADPETPLVLSISEHITRRAFEEYKEELHGIVGLLVSRGKAAVLMHSSAVNELSAECMDACRKAMTLFDAAAVSQFALLDHLVDQRQRDRAAPVGLYGKLPAQQVAAEWFLNVAVLISQGEHARANLWKRAAQAQESGFKCPSDDFDACAAAKAYCAAAQALEEGNEEACEAWIQCASKYQDIWELSRRGRARIASKLLSASRDVACCWREIAQALALVPPQPQLVAYRRAFLEPTVALEDCARSRADGYHTESAAAESSRRVLEAQNQIQTLRAAPPPEPALPEPPLPEVVIDPPSAPTSST